IGRPSTYAPTISTVQKRNYVEKDSREGRERISIECRLQKGDIKRLEAKEMTGAEKNKLFPTNTAMVVNDFLVDHFPNVIDYSFTADVEQQFDDIAHGKTVWNQMINNFYGGFHSTVEKSQDLDRSEVNQARELGEDPKTGEKIYARHGKYGAYVQKGELIEGEEKPQYASLKHGQFMDTITIEEALELFKLPREVGLFEDKPMVAAVGRFGPYIRHDGKFASLKKEQDPLTITEEEAVTLILEKREADANKFIKTFDEDPEAFVLNGRYGPYIKFGKKNVKIPKDKKPEELTYAECK
ncbi:MAG: topoisomerase C-terminal repeat-containing protein, partial [Bacteroidota bacterium]